MCGSWNRSPRSCSREQCATSSSQSRRCWCSSTMRSPMTCSAGRLEEDTMGTQLPADFIDLEPYAQRWAHPGEGERFATLVNASIGDARAFYGAIFPRALAAKAHLEKFDFHALPASE